MDPHDEQIGRVLTRREVLALLGAAGAATMLARAPWLALAQDAAPGDVPLPACIVTPEQAEGPFFVDERLERADIRPDIGADGAPGEVADGVPLALALRVFRIGRDCEPLPGAVVDVWHCDALGRYSDVRDRTADTVGRSFLRGYQVTDANGEVRFRTIYPGWYPGRAVHIHFKVRAPDAAGREVEFTSQFYFHDALSDEIHTREPYAREGAEGRTPNARDGLFRNGGERLLLDARATAEGYAASFDIGLHSG